MIKIRYVNLSVKNKNLRKDYIQTLKKVFDHGRFILGPEVSLLEKKSLKETSINKKRILDYNIIFSKIYLFLKKILFLFRNFKKR